MLTVAQSIVPVLHPLNLGIVFQDLQFLIKHSVGLLGCLHHVAGMINHCS